VVLTFIFVCIIFLGVFSAAFLRLWRNPPVIVVKVDVPGAFVVQHQHVPAQAETDKPIEEPIPEDILDYILGESDAWAQEARKRKARELKRETGSWDTAFRLLQREDALE
jgi:hypothetical protein